MIKSLRREVLLLSFFLWLIAGLSPVHAQTNVPAEPEKLTDQQLQQIVQQEQRSGMSDEQLFAQLSQKGWSAAQIATLSARLRQFRAGNTGTRTDTVRRQLNYRPDSTTVIGPAKTLPAGQLRVFGSDLFANENIRFEPNLNLATPVNYIVGPGDQLNISVYGVSQANWKLEVSPEGNINIPGVGIVNVSGRPISQATALIRSRLLAGNYPLGRGSSLQVSLGNIRSIKVIMVGQLVKPGTYTLPSLATVFNALYSAGGPNVNGSFRMIEVIRQNRVIRKVDIYDFLLSGDQRDNINLQDQDIIRVPAYTNRVELSGQVKVPAIFEVLPKETLQNVLDFAGGFTDSAYTRRIKVTQIVDGHRHLADIPEAQFGSYHPQRGDRFNAESIIDRYDNRVTILGAVYRPGVYQLDTGLTLSALIRKADGLKEDAYPERGTITRLRADRTTEVIAFRVRDIANKVTDITLQNEDRVDIASLFDLRDAYRVSVNGAVRKPGEYPFAANMKVEDLIYQAGGFSEGASARRVEVARRVSKEGNPAVGTIATVFTINANGQLRPDQAGFTLVPFDIVSVYNLPGYQPQRTVKVEGEVTYPGLYAIQSDSDKVSDLVRRVGGLTHIADIAGATLIRENTATLGLDRNQTNLNEVLDTRRTQLNRLARQSNDSTAAAIDAPRNNSVGIDLAAILDHPGSRADLLLENNDILRIPKKEQVVKVSGEVLFPSDVVYTEGKSLREYINNAGSFSATAWPKRTYIVYPNGTVRSTHKFLFFKLYPDVRPGSEIFVPKKPVRVNNSLQEVLGVTTALASVGAIILGILSLRR